MGKASYVRKDGMMYKEHEKWRMMVENRTGGELQSVKSFDIFS